MTMISPSGSPRSTSETKPRVELPLSVRLLHEQADHMFPGDKNLEFRKRLKATQTSYEFYRCLSESPRA